MNDTAPIAPAPEAPHFFISRAGPNAAFAVKIAHILEKANYRVFIQDRDIINESILAAMQKALTSGARTIALLSKDYLDPKRVHCAAEWQATIARDPVNTNRRLILFRVEDCAPTGLLEPLAYWDLAKVAGDDALLADIVLGAVDPEAGTRLPEALARYWSEADPIVHHEVRPTPNFVDHEDALDRIDQALWHGQSRIAGITQPIATFGMGGIGKSTLAREYAFQVSRGTTTYAGIWWLNAERDRTNRAFNGIEAGLLDLRQRLYPGAEPPTERHQAARGMFDYIGRFSKPWLLVYDNADDMAVLQAWPPPANAHVLLTTRLTAFRKGEVMPIAIEEWALPDAVRYLADESGRGDVASAQWEALASALGRLPLALSHAAAYLRETPTATPASYLAAIERRLSSAPPGMTDSKPVYATFQEAIAHAERGAPGARAVMTFLAMLAPDNIPMELLAQDPALYPPALRAVVADPDGIESNTGMLARLSLIEFDRQSATISVHRLVQLAASHELKADDRAAWHAAAIAIVAAAHPGFDYNQWPAYERLLPHALALIDTADEAMGAPLANVCGQAASYFHDRATYDLAEPLFQRTLSVFEKALGPDHPSVGTSLNNLAELYRAQGKYDRAEPLYKRSLEISEKALGPDHPSVGTSLNNLAGIYYAQGQYDLAEPLYKRTLSIFEKALGPDHPDVGTSLNNLAGLYRAQGQYDLAAPLYKRSLEIREKALEPDHPEVGTSLNNLAGLYRAQGKYDLANPLYKRSLEISEKALGPDHPSVGTALNNLAALYESQGKYDLAEPLYKRTVSILEKALGPDHPDVGTSLNNLAILYEAQSHYHRAEPLYKRSLEISEKALGPDHPSVGTSLNNLTGIYYAQGQYDLAEPLYKRTLSIFEKALGPDHPSIGISLNNLAELYRAQGKYDLAEPLYKRSLAISEKALGPDHPDVGASLNNLALLYFNTDRLDEAVALARRARSILVTALGADHPNTKIVSEVTATIEAAIAERDG